ncbi:MAG: glucose-6-phosphate isomerase [Planctomycetes bacterium]|nr:glucose-6-phosphate isomerase [Planctomycetota bacterium]
MKTDRLQLWDRYRQYLCAPPGLDLRLDPSRMDFDEGFLKKMAPAMDQAFDAMERLEAGDLANPDEQRMVGHYWLRDPERAPSAEIRDAIKETLERIRRFAQDVQSGKIRPTRAARFENLLVIGIGGSALGPQFVSDALGDQVEDPRRALRLFFMDNTDPDGLDRVLAAVRGAPGGLAATLAVVISKSGGTPETRNGMLEAASAYGRSGLAFPPHAAAITSAGSQLDRKAAEEKWLVRFPMWDWVGGRTSELSAVGLVPAALQGIDLDGLLAGARQMDAAARVRDPLRNPAALLALMWHFAGNGKGEKEMVILPYKDRLALLSRYLQQLVMESLGKEKDLDGKVVHQGIAVYGNKGSTDQHAYIQQLRDGLPNFFATFIQVLEDRRGESIEVEPGITSGDYLRGLLLGTRQALYENGRGSITITVRRVDAPAIGRLIALFERAVGLYASLIRINAYHQPGVEAGKKAAASVLALQQKVMADLKGHAGQLRDAEAIARSIGAPEEAETVFHILEHRAANPQLGPLAREGGDPPYTARFGLR